MKVTALTNIGSGLEKKLERIDVKSAEDFLRKDPKRLFFELKKIEPNIHPAVLACFVGAHNKTPWYFIYPEIKKELDQLGDR